MSDIDSRRSPGITWCAHATKWQTVISIGQKHQLKLGGDTYYTPRSNSAMQYCKFARVAPFNELNVFARLEVLFYIYMVSPRVSHHLATTAHRMTAR